MRVKVISFQTLLSLQEPEIDIMSDAGEKPQKSVGEIEFSDVHFQYPSRPDVKVSTS